MFQFTIRSIWTESRRIVHAYFKIIKRLQQVLHLKFTLLSFGAKTPFIIWTRFIILASYSLNIQLLDMLFLFRKNMSIQTKITFVACSKLFIKSAYGQFFFVVDMQKVTFISIFTRSLFPKNTYFLFGLTFVLFSLNCFIYIK